MEAITGFLTELFRQYGYYIVFFGLFIENMVVIGIFFPGETIFLLACFLSAQGTLNIGYLVVLAISGAVIGNVVGYFIGLKGGDMFFEKISKRKSFQRKLMNSEEFFSAYGGKTVFLARFAAGVRSFIPALAGASKMKFHIFFWYSFTAIIIWTLIAANIGYFFGSNIDFLLKIFNQFGLLIFSIFIVVVIIIFNKKRANK
jgi:membrane-associated protein